MAARSYYFIKNQQNGLYVTIQGSALRPSGVIASNQLPEGNNDGQLWYDDPVTGTIRNKANNLCLDIEGQRVVLANQQPGSSTQMWERCGSIVRRRTSPNVVLAIGQSAGPGSQIEAQMSSGAWTQLFDFLFWYPPQPTAYVQHAYAPAYACAPSAPVPAAPSKADLDLSLKMRKFYIISELNNKVIDIKGGSGAVNTPIIMWSRKPAPENNQLWYFDSQGFIYSALNDFVFQSAGNGGRLAMGRYRGDPRHQWSLSGNRIMNKTNECVDIVGESRNEGAELCSYGYKASNNQHWRIEYI